MLSKKAPYSQKQNAPGFSSFRVFAFSGVLWILSAWLNQIHHWFPQTYSFTNPGVLATPPSLWLKAGAGVTVNTGGVSYWRDQSGNGAHAYQPNTNYRPEWVEDYFNFNPVLDFGGVDEFVYGSSGFSTQTFFIVVHNDEAFSPRDAGQALLNFGANGNNYLGLGAMTSLVDNEFISFGIVRDTVYRSALAANGYITAGPHMFASWRNTGSSGPRQMIQVNGQTTVNTEYNRAGYDWVDDEEYVIAGKLNTDRSVRNIFDGKVAEVIAFDAVLGKFDRAKVQSYLALKYGLTLDQNQSDPDLRAYYDARARVIWDPTRHPDFNRDIAGIGQDDESSLYQPKSKSSNDDTYVTIGSPTDLSHGEFLIWANDGGSMTYVAEGAPAGYRRVERRWQVQETGDVGAVEITGLGTHMVIDREGDGFANDTPLPAGTPVNLNDGDVFTFLVVNIELCGAPGGVGGGLKTWLRADAGVSTTASGTVSYWEDYSGNNHYAAQSESGRQPTWSAEAINFNPAVNFEETLGQFLESPTGGFSTHDYFLVFVPNDEIYAGGGAGTLIGAGLEETRFDFGYNAFSSALTNELLFHALDFGGSYSSGLTSDQRIIDSFFPYIANARDKSAGNGTEIYFNGLPITNAESGQFTSLENAGFSLGASIAGTRPHDGRIAEFIVYDGPNTEAARRRIQSYLALKYGITLDQSAGSFTDRHYYSSNGAIIWNAQRNEAYAHDLAGIGQDAGSCLLQPRSQSQNPDGILRIGPASDLDEGEFLIWGNNGQPLTQSGQDNAPAGFFTLARSWRAQETGEVGQVEIAFANGALGRSNGAGYFLVVDSDNDGSFADETPRSFSFDGEEFKITGVDLNDGARFTIAVNCSGVAVAPSPIREEYYLPVPEDQLLQVLQKIYPSAAACNRTITAREPRAPVFNYTSITTQGQGTIIVYDHWEDGFETDLENPQQASTEIWGDGNPLNGYPPGFPCDIILADAIVLNETLDPSDRGAGFYYDGGDHLGASGPIAITKANWSEGGRTLFAGAVEVFATEFWSENYVIPFGENIVTATQSFEYVGALIMAREDQTTVSIDLNGDGAAEETVVLNRGQSRLVNGGVRSGALVNASAPVQVHLATGDICDNFESRWFTLPGNDVTCDAYYSAVADNSVMYYFYNPNNTSILIKHQTGQGPQSDILVPAKGYITKFFGTSDRAGHHFHTENGRPFYVAFFYSMNDFTGRGSAYDWGATLVCEDLLPRSLQLGWAYGQDPTLPQFENGSPIWLTAAYPTGSQSSGPIQVCVDFNGDNAGPFSDGDGRNFDLLLSLDEYEAVRLFDPDGDQTGTIISVCDGSDAILSVHWGADQDAASASEPGLDLGTGIPFTLPFYVDKLVEGRAGDDTFLAGEEIAYTISVSPLGQNIISGPFLIQDELPAGLSYLPGTAELILPGGSVQPLADDVTGQTLFPLDEEGLTVGASSLIHPGEQLAVRFAVRIDPAANGEVLNRAVVRQGIYEREDEVRIEVTGRQESFDLALAKNLHMDVVPGPFAPGDYVTFRIDLSNQGTLTARNIQVNDYIPPGLSLDDPNWTETGPGIATLNTPIATLTAGDEISVNIRFRIHSGFQGDRILNRAEIAAAANDENRPDVDSQPDSDPTNDAPGEDDHDSEEIQVRQTFDLALIKTLHAATPGPFTPGDPVTFTIEVRNQGTLDATNIQINDYFPAGMILADPDWAETAPGRAQLRTALAGLPAGQTAQLNINFVIDENFQGNTLLNIAEIREAGNGLGLADTDSTPDDLPDNDAGGAANTPSDNTVDGDGSGQPGDAGAATDEDDHDPALIRVGQVFDLALIKRLDTGRTPGPFQPGDAVRFTIQVVNQGTRDATRIQITDYLPPGLALADDEWTADGQRALYTLEQPLAANGGSITIPIDLIIDAAFTGTSLINAAEISAADDDDDPANAPPLDADSTYDQDPDNDAGGAPGSPADDAINGNGQGAPGDSDPATDEDDHDVARITLCSPANAGEDGTAQVCAGCGTTDVYLDLFAALNGSPDAGGLWTDLSGAGVDLANPRQVDFSAVPPGTYRFRYTFDHNGACNNQASEVTVTVRSYAAMACNNLINVSFATGCSVQVTPDLVLEGNVPCPSDYEIRLYDETGQFLGDIVTGDQAGQTITAEVYNLTCGTSCTAQVRLTDQVAPQITCPQTTVDLVCSDADTIFNNPATLWLTGQPTAQDDCSADLDISFLDEISKDGDCGLTSIARRFTVTDPSGNQNSCLQLINVRKPGFADVTFPPAEVDLNCAEEVRLNGNGRPHPSETGYPEVSTRFGRFAFDQVYCNLGASYSDSEPIVQCPGTYTLVRTWTLVDWCAASNPTVDFIQLINIQDQTPPVVTCPPGAADTLRFSTGPFDCTATFAVPMPQVSDNCSDWTVAVEVVTDEEVPVFDRFGRIIDTIIETRVLATVPAGSPSPYVTGIPAGCHRFRYTVADACDNVTIRECHFCVSDDIEPVAVCEDRLTVSLGGGGIGRLTAADLNQGSWDNCGLDALEIRRAVRRNEDCIAVAESFSEWSDAVFVNCCDLESDVIVELSVTDRSGNRNTCRATLTVEDKIRPACVAPAAVSVNCNELPYGFDPADTTTLQTLFGVAGATDNCTETGWQELPPQVNLTDCGDGSITRTFRAYDGQGNSSTNTCRQIVTIEAYHEYEIRFPADVSSSCSEETAPGLVLNTMGCDDLGYNIFDQTFTDIPGICARTLRRYRVINWCTYDETSDPVIVGRDEDCDGEGGDEPVWVIHRDGVTYIDRDNDPQNGQPAAGQRLNCPPNNPSGYWRTVSSVGFWQYTQWIDVIDDTPAAIRYEQPPAFCSETEDCQAPVALPFTVEDNCDQLAFQLALDENNDGSTDRSLNPAEVLSGNFPDYVLAADLPIGNHAIEVRVTDGCGRMTTQRMAFTVADCRAPVPDCVPELTVNLEPVEEGIDADGDGIPDLGAFRVAASDLLTAKPTDCSGPVRLSIHREGEAPDPEQTALVLTCDDADTVRVRVYAWDMAGNPYADPTGGANYDYCQTILLVKDELFEACTPKYPGRISGLIMTELGNAVENVMVNLSGPEGRDNMTNIGGAYLFENLQLGYDYTITPNLDLSHRNGVTTFDLTIMEKHILGTQKIDSPYKLIAADINRSGTISVLDVIQMRRLILGEVDEFEYNTSWRFVREDYNFPDPTNPFATFIPEVITVNDLPGRFNDGDFVGVKVGDLNHTAIANSNMGVIPRALADTLYFTAEDRLLRAGQEYRIPFYVPALAQTEGYQYTMEYRRDRISLLEVEPGVARALNFGRRYTAEGLLTTSWHRTGAVSEDERGPMFTLVLRAEADGLLSEALRLTSRITEAEAYDRAGEMRAVSLDFRTTETVSAPPRLEQNVPNPFAGQTVIDYWLPQETRIRFAVYDLQGREIYVESGWRPAGEHRVQLEAHQLGLVGIYYYELVTEDGFRETRKLAVVR